MQLLVIIIIIYYEVVYSCRVGIHRCCCEVIGVVDIHSSQCPAIGIDDMALCHPTVQSVFNKQVNRIPVSNSPLPEWQKALYLLKVQSCSLFTGVPGASRATFDSCVRDDLTDAYASGLHPKGNDVGTKC